VASARDVGFDNGALDVGGDGPDRRLAEGARLAADADQHGRAGVAGDVEEVDAIRVLQGPAGHGLARLHERALGVADAGHALDEQAVAVDGEEPAAGLGLGQAGVDERAQQQGGDAAAGRAGAEHGDALLGERHAGHADGRQQGPGGHRGGALDVVVEGAQAIAVALEQAAGVVVGEVLELQQDVGPAAHHRVDEQLDELVVGRAADPRAAPADVQRVGEALRVVGADVEEDRQRAAGVDAGAGGVERELADRDAHAAGALIAEAEDALAVADADHPHVVEPRAGEDLGDAGAVGPAQEQTARVAPDLREALAALADGRGVDQRQQLGRVAHEHGVEQGLVGVLEVAEEGVALERVVAGPQGAQAAGDLLLEVADVRRQQAVELEVGALGVGEGGALVEQRVGQQVGAVAIGDDHVFVVDHRGMIPAAVTRGPG
jgi:hypothetical protein